MARVALLVLAAMAGGAANAVAGGGTFLVFPALLFAGVPSVAANATSSVVLWPGGVASAWVYRRQMEEPPSRLALLSLLSAAGGLLGSLVLLRTSSHTFDRMVPWLLLFATLLFTFSEQIGRALPQAPGRVHSGPLAVGQCLIAFYGGYFGGGMGVLMLALYTAVGGMNAHRANSLRAVCASVINAVAVLVFVVRRAINWHFGLPMVAGALAGGYFLAVVVRSLPTRSARRVIVTCAWVVTALFLVKEVMRWGA